MKTVLTWLRHHLVMTVLALTLLIGGGYYFFGTQEKEAAVVTKSETLTVERGSLKMTVSGSGQIEAASQVDLKPVAAGDAIEVTAVAVKNDQEVKKGQLIATIDSEDALRDVRGAQLSLKSAQIKMQQTEADYDNKNADETLIRRAQEVSVKQQELALEKSLAKLSDYSIRAPFDGIVTGLSVESGDTISQTAVLASIITKELRAVISLNEVDAVGVKAGDNVTLTFNALPNTTLSGKIAKIDTIGTASQGVVTYGAEVSFEEQDAMLKPGMSVTAEIVVAQKENVVLVPNEALTYAGDRTFVQTVSGEKKRVETGMTDNVSTEIVSGLNEKDQIVIVKRNTSGTALGTGSQSGQGNVLNSLLRGNRPTGNR